MLRGWWPGAFAGRPQERSASLAQASTGARHRPAPARPLSRRCSQGVRVGLDNLSFQQAGKRLGHERRVESGAKHHQPRAIENADAGQQPGGRLRASRVLPLPPAPVRVTRRVDSNRRTPGISCSRDKTGRAAAGCALGLWFVSGTGGPGAASRRSPRAAQEGLVVRRYLQHPPGARRSAWKGDALQPLVCGVMASSHPLAAPACRSGHVAAAANRRMSVDHPHLSEPSLVCDSTVESYTRSVLKHRFLDERADLAWSAAVNLFQREGDWPQAAFVGRR